MLESPVTPGWVQVVVQAQSSGAVAREGEATATDDFGLVDRRQLRGWTARAPAGQRPGGLVFLHRPPTHPAYHCASFTKEAPCTTSQLAWARPPSWPPSARSAQTFPAAGKSITIVIAALGQRAHRPRGDLAEACTQSPGRRHRGHRQYRGAGGTIGAARLAVRSPTATPCC